MTNGNNGDGINHPEADRASAVSVCSKARAAQKLLKNFVPAVAVQSTVDNVASFRILILAARD
jgi:hypothetical protein